MRVKILKHPYGTVYMAGDVVELPDDEVKRLVEAGYAERVAVKVKQKPAKAKAAVKVKKER